MKGFIGILITGMILTGLSAQANEDRRNLLSVSGECLKMVPQDRAAVTLTADFLDANAGNATKKATDQYNTLVTKVKALKLKDMELETSEYSVQEDFDYTANTRKSRGFRARNGLRVETSDIARIGEAIKIGADLGLKSISGLSMFVSREKWKQEREVCLEEAYANARSKADRLAKVSGVKITGVARMDESGSPSFAPRAFGGENMMMAADMGRAKVASIESKSEQLQVTLSVQYLLQ